MLAGAIRTQAKRFLRPRAYASSACHERQYERTKISLHVVCQKPALVLTYTHNNKPLTARLVHNRSYVSISYPNTPARVHIVASADAPIYIGIAGVSELGQQRPVVLPAPPQTPRAYGITNIKIITNPDLEWTAARFHTHTGRVELARWFTDLPLHWQVYFLLHEIGHYYYTSEELADKYALENFINMGYGPSQAVYAMAMTLAPRAHAVKRTNLILTAAKARDEQNHDHTQSPGLGYTGCGGGGTCNCDC